MPISQSLNNALSGLNAASRAAEVVSSNLANAMTEGYGRRELVVSARDIGGDGAGVRVDGVIRHANPVIIAERRLADAQLGHAQTYTQGLSRLENLFGKVGGGTSLADQINRLEQSFIRASADPSSEIVLNDISAEISKTVTRFKAVSDGIQDLRQQADQSIADQVTRLNTNLQRLDRLNKDIARTAQEGHDTSGLFDQRQAVVDKISEIVPVKQLTRPAGQVALITSEGQMLVDDRAVEVGFQPAGTIVTEMTFASSALSGLSIDGDPALGPAPLGRFGGGSLAAAFELRDTALPNAAEQLDQLAADFVTRLSDPAVDPTIPAGSTGLVSVGAPGFNPANIAGLASRLEVNSAIDPLQGGNPAAIRDGLFAAGGAPGSAALLNAWADQLSLRTSFSAGEPARGLSAHSTFIATGISTERVRHEDDTAFAQARVDALKTDELSEAVDSDQEMQRLLMIEKAYAANAKVIATVDSMIQSLLEI